MSSKLKITFNTTDYVVIALTVFFLLITWLYVIVAYPKLPEIIATHFDGAGKPNGYGTKNTIWYVPVIFTLLSIGSFFAAKQPKYLDFSFKKTSEQEYKKSSKILLLSSLLLSVIALLISYSMIVTSLNKGKPTAWILKLILAITVIYLIFVFYFQFKSTTK